MDGHTTLKHYCLFVPVIRQINYEVKVFQVQIQLLLLVKIHMKFLFVLSKATDREALWRIKGKLCTRCRRKVSLNLRPHRQREGTPGSL